MVVHEAPSVPALLKPVATLAEVMQLQKDVHRLIAESCKEGIDYGAIPGTRDDKRVLLKAGAEKINLAFGTAVQYALVEQEIDHDREIQWSKWKWGKARGEKVITTGTSYGLYRYVVKCTLIHRPTGTILGAGYGSCSTMENKYVEDPRDRENTVLKMAQKRAFVGVTLNVFGLSDRFTADLEDMDQPLHQPSSNDERQQRPRQQQQRPISAVPDWSLQDDRIKVGKLKGQQLSAVDEETLIKYGEWLTNQVNTGKAPPETQSHLVQVYAEVARREGMQQPQDVDPDHDEEKA